MAEETKAELMEELLKIAIEKLSSLGNVAERAPSIASRLDIARQMVHNNDRIPEVKAAISAYLTHDTGREV